MQHEHATGERERKQWTAGDGAKRWSVAPALAVALVLLLAPQPRAQEYSQLWANLTFDWVTSERLTYELDFEPKALVNAPAGEPGWKNLDVTPSVSFSATRWIDLTGEFVTGYTRQTDDVSSFELTPRIGADFHVLSRVLASRERQPKRRLALDNYFRVEWRNFLYSDNEPNPSAWRFRNRLGCIFAINRQKHTDDGAYYVLTDWEWFLPLSDPTERFANRQRFRVGFGYRRSFHWRFETLYMWARSRDTIEEQFETSERILDVRIKRFF
jgi:hypothetical protein